MSLVKLKSGGVVGGLRGARMGWYCPRCRTEFTEYQPICPFCNVKLRRSRIAFE
ncbi:MAG: hypothetical protein V1857_06190 [archaeon]